MKEGEEKFNKIEGDQIGNGDEADKNKIAVKDRQEGVESPTNFREITAAAVFDMMAEAKIEFSDEIQKIIGKKANKGQLSSKEQSKFDKARSDWFKTRFGISFDNRLLFKKGVAARLEADERKREQSFDFMARSNRKIDADTRALLDKLSGGQELSKDEIDKLSVARNAWWTANFGSSYKLWNGEINPSTANILRRQGVEVENNEKLGKIDTGIVSERELLDLKMSPNSKGWLRYWVSKLKSELDIIPEAISPLVLEAVKEGKLSDEKREKLAKYVERRIQILKFSVEKRQRMSYLKDQLTAIDEEKDFYNEEEKQKRKPVFFDDQAHKFYVEEGGTKNYIGLGDIIADYAWGIRYRPDDSLSQRIKRMVEKRIVINEARRDIENTYDQELSQIYGVSQGVSNIGEDQLESLAKKYLDNKRIAGVIAERAVIEFLTRVSLNNPEINFFIERSNAFEDTELKYDFKIRQRVKTRGVALEGFDTLREEYKEAKRKIGLQFTIAVRPEVISHKKIQIEEAKKRLELSQRFVKRKVDDVVLVAVDLPKFGEYFKKWLQEGKPSGGPEQYMSREEKVSVLSEVTKGFIQISGEEIDKIFPPEPAEFSEKKAA